MAEVSGLKEHIAVLFAQEFHLAFANYRAIERHLTTSELKTMATSNMQRSSNAFSFIYTAGQMSSASTDWEEHKKKTKMDLSNWFMSLQI